MNSNMDLNLKQARPYNYNYSCSLCHVPYNLDLLETLFASSNLQAAKKKIKN